MSKKDLLIVIALFALWISWPILDRHVIRRYFFPAPPPGEAVAAAEEAAAPVEREQPAISEPAAEPAQPEEPAAPLQEAKPETPAEPEQVVVLENAKIRVELSSRGGTLKSAMLKEYRATVEPDSSSVTLQFGDERALALVNVDGFTPDQAFVLTETESGKAVQLERRNAAGLRLLRTVNLTEHYLIQVSDTWVNEGASAAVLPAHELRTGAMENLDGAASRGVVYLGVDTLSPGGEKVQHLGGKLPGWFKENQKEKELPKLPLRLERSVGKPVDWAAAKNKYFVQILTPDGGSEDAVVRAIREVSEAERQNPQAGPKAAVLNTVSVAVVLPELTLQPGEKFVRNTQYYVGPKKYSELNLYGLHQVDIMEFGMWAPIGKLLLKIMNWIYDVLWPHNYGIAIMLLTIIIRIVFWPVTHKSTESMKRMQALQPLMTEIRAKYKDNQQKMQQELMNLYKEHKVNPLGGCLPMLIQIPVFIALFVVLRSAIELRFAPFLWIRDLSQPENLLAGVLPIPVNVLPIIMAVTMVWQQKLTPGTGDPSQQKMMMFMPVMMLVMFYNFAAGLTLYWTTNQCLMIVQQLIMHRQSARKAAGAAA